MKEWLRIVHTQAFLMWQTSYASDSKGWTFDSKAPGFCALPSHIPLGPSVWLLETTRPALPLGWSLR